MSRDDFCPLEDLSAGEGADAYYDHGVIREESADAERLKGCVPVEENDLQTGRK